jgi:hypothetical protein
LTGDLEKPKRKHFGFSYKLENIQYIPRTFPMPGSVVLAPAVPRRFDTSPTDNRFRFFSVSIDEICSPRPFVGTFLAFGSTGLGVTK